MRLLVYRLIGCAAGLLAGRILFNTELSSREIILSVILMALFYTFLRPLINIVILPFNLILLGVPGLLVDALFVYWAAGRGFGYLQALFIAVIVALCYLPYKRYKYKVWEM